MLPHSPSASGLWASTRATLLHTAEEAPLCPGEPSRILLTDKPLVRPELTPGSEKATALQVKMVRCGHLDPTPSPKLHPQQKSETQRGHTMLRKQGYCAGPQRGKQRPGNEVRNETEHRAEVGRPEQQSREQWGRWPRHQRPSPEPGALPRSGGRVRGAREGLGSEASGLRDGDPRFAEATPRGERSRHGPPQKLCSPPRPAPCHSARNWPVKDGNDWKTTSKEWRHRHVTWYRQEAEETLPQVQWPARTALPGNREVGKRGLPKSSPSHGSGGQRSETRLSPGWFP